MPEKVFLCLKSSMWGIVIAWTQIILCVLKLLITIQNTVWMLYYYVEHSYTGHEDVGILKDEESDISFEFGEPLQYGNSFSWKICIYMKPKTILPQSSCISVYLIEVLLFICGFVFALVMGVILLKGCRQRHVPYLKAWLIFAVISIFWNILFFGLITLSFGFIAELIIDFLEVFLFLPLYMFGFWIIYDLMITILTDQNPGGEILPKYESLAEEITL